MDLIKVVKPSRFVFFLACLAAMAMLFISEGAYWQSADSLTRLGTISDARLQLFNVRRGILAAEAGQRGYLLTGRKEYLKPYNAAIADIQKSFGLLANFYDVNTAPHESLKQLRALTSDKLSELDEALRLYDAGKPAESTDIILSNLNKTAMEDISDSISKLLDATTQMAEMSSLDIFRTLMLSRVGLATLSAACLFAMYLFLRKSAALNQHELQLKQNLRAKGARLEAEVGERTAQLTDLTRHLQSAREDERNRLARDLHDDLGALLTSAKLDAARIKSRLAAAPEALELLAHLVGTLNNSIALGRRIIEDLRPSALTNLGLVPTLEILANEFSEQTGMKVHCDLKPVALEPSASIMVYRLVQEAFTNITKYAGASQVWITLGEVNGVVTASVRDDGVGFDTTLKRISAFGLMGMRYRVEAEGGVLTLNSVPGQGTLIEATVPLVAPSGITEDRRLVTRQA